MSDRPNVVWVTVESTRADHTSLCGYERDTTPNLERIASTPRGRSFDTCFAHGIWTLSSSASILTGTVPSHHDAGMESDAIPESLRTLPEMLGDLGYRTAGLSTNFHVSEATGLDRGFDRFEWLSRDTVLKVVGYGTLAKYLANIYEHSAGLTTDTGKHSTGYLVTEVLKRWLRKLRGDQPYFLYAHYGDPHHPYYPPLPYHDRYLDDVGVPVKRARDLALDHHDNINEHVAAGCPFSDDEWAALEAMYDAEIAYTDELIGRLFDYVTSVSQDTIFVVTADHGELFGEQGMLAHKVVTDDAVSHVPLVVYGLDGLTEYEGELVQHADIVETLLSELGHRPDQTQGVDLTSERRSYAVVQRGAKRAEKNLEDIASYDGEFDTNRYHGGRLDAIRTRSFKYQEGGTESELLELPDEETDRSDQYPEMAARMRRTLDEWLESRGSAVDQKHREREYSEAVKRQMADLGYLE